jgi:hypothetical protein
MTAIRLLDFFIRLFGSRSIAILISERRVRKGFEDKAREDEGTRRTKSTSQ